MLANRLVTGTILIAITALVLGVDQWLAPWFPFWFLTASVVMVASALEVVNLLGVAGPRPSGNTVVGGVLALVVANWIPHLIGHIGAVPPSLITHDAAAASHALSWPLWAFVAVVMVAFVGQGIQYRGPGRAMATIAGTVLATAYIGLLGSFVLQFRWLEGPHDGLIPLSLLIATAKGTDIGAYTVGRLAGRHKLWPQLSPNKTIEGGIGGLIFAVGAALIVVRVADLLHIATLTVGEAIGFGLVVGVAAQLGDLMESMMKRDCEQKDASSTLPGFGGVLDVMDSLLFAGPVAYGYWLCFGP